MQTFKLIFSEAVTDYNGEAASIKTVRIANPCLTPERQTALVGKLNRRFEGHAVFALEGSADSTVFVGRSAEIPFLGLAESNDGGNAFVNLDRTAPDELIFEVAAHEAGHLLGLLRHDGVGLAACAYKGGESVTLNSGESVTGEVIADETSYTLVEPYAKTLTLNAGAGATETAVYTGGEMIIAAANVLLDTITVSGGGVSTTAAVTFDHLTVNGGVVSATGGATFRSLNITAGNVSAYGGGKVYGATITGGVLRLVGANVAVGSDLKITGTGQLQWGAGAYLAGAATEIYEGAITNQNTAKVENGVMTGLNIAGASRGIGDGLTVSDAVVGNGTTAAGMMLSGTDIKVSGGTVAAKAFLKVVAGANVLVNNVTVAGSVYASNGGVSFENLKVAGGVVSATGGERFVNLEMTDGAVSAIGGFVSGGTVDGGTLNVYDGGVVSNVMQNNGTVKINSGAIASGGEVVGGEMDVWDAAGNGIARGVAQTGGTIIIRHIGNLADSTTVGGGIFYVQSGASATNLTISTGGTVRVYRLGADTATAATLIGASVTGGTLEVYSQGVASNVTQTGGMVKVYENAVLKDAGVVGGTLNISANAVVDGLTVTGGTLNIIATAGTITNATVTADAEINIDYTAGGSGTARFDNLANVAGTIKLKWNGDTGTYVIGGAAATGDSLSLDCGSYHDIFDIAVKSGKQYSNAFWGRNFDFSDGMTLNTNTFSVGVETTAAALNAATATALADGGFAAIWTANTDTSGVSVVADAYTTGDAWVTVNGASLATPLYGAEGNFAHDVNMWIYEGTVRNLAAGATAGGSVENVNLLISDNGEGTDKLTFTGVAYLGGFGNVTGEVTAAVYGGSYNKDFYAGALANKLDAQTAVGSVNLTVKSGKFSGNIYGGSAVKTDTTVGNGTRNTTGDVTLTISGGETTRGTQACIFAGGYATGDATGTVYTVDSVTATISGGSWGEAAGGRGIFGGIMASGVTAQVIGDVNLTVSGGSMGNVYGGGWAQKNGTSIVGDVEITITGTAQVANVFGGGSHSTSGGTTETASVSITVSGGSISGAIYAKGQLDGDSVTGKATVTFTGSNAYTCDVYGYSYVGTSGGSEALTFAGFTGSFSGDIGGFNAIEFSDGTAMTLTTAADDVSNTSWKFDVSARAEALAGTALLDWDAADFTGNTIKLNLATGSTSEWTLVDATASTAYNQFDVLVNDESILSDTIGLDEAIIGGAYDGWGFTIEDTALKFKHLA